MMGTCAERRGPTPKVDRAREWGAGISALTTFDDDDGGDGPVSVRYGEGSATDIYCHA